MKGNGFSCMERTRRLSSGSLMLWGKPDDSANWSTWFVERKNLEFAWPKILHIIWFLSPWARDRKSRSTAFRNPQRYPCSFSRVRMRVSLNFVTFLKPRFCLKASLSIRCHARVGSVDQWGVVSLACFNSRFNREFGITHSRNVFQVPIHGLST